MKHLTEAEEQFWSTRYAEGRTGWDIGSISTTIKAYIDQLDDTEISILVPGAGNGHEVEYIYASGFRNVSILDISAYPLKAFQARVPSFPKDQIIQANVFNHVGQYDLIIEQTFFCSFLPTLENRMLYAETMAKLIKPGGILVGLWFDIPLEETTERPFGGSKQEYIDYLSPYFTVKTMEPCYNSIKPRSGKELFGIFVRK